MRRTGGGGQAARAPAEELHLHGQAGWRAPAVSKLGDVSKERGGPRDGLADAQELRHGEGKCSGGALEGTHGSVCHPLHRGEDHGRLDRKHPTIVRDTTIAGGGVFSHPSGLNVGFGDGSVRFVTFAVRAEIWATFGTRAGGESSRRE